MKPRYLAYIIWSIFIVLIAYLIPYSLLKNVEDLTLCIFWIAISALHALVTIAYLEKYKLH